MLIKALINQRDNILLQYFLIELKIFLCEENVVLIWLIFFVFVGWHFYGHTSHMLSFFNCDEILKYFYNFS